MGSGGVRRPLLGGLAKGAPLCCGGGTIFIGGPTSGGTASIGTPGGGIMYGIPYCWFGSIGYGGICLIP